jgi:hypothetical protein
LICRASDRGWRKDKTGGFIDVGEAESDLRQAVGCGHCTRAGVLVMLAARKTFLFGEGYNPADSTGSQPIASAGKA